jgi:DNA helicase-2/ATP-dependent DNA helicase PcrA
MNLDKQQKMAVEHDEGCCMVIAVPGSGKTTVLVERIIRLVKEKKAAPEQILVLTFTRQAAASMQSRYYSRMKGQGNGVFFGTFHSAFFRILQKEHLTAKTYDEVLTKCLWMLEEYPQKLHYWQEQFQYLFIDEFQDINEIQLQIVCLLAARHHNLFVVGDDDQSIYRFRGARPNIMLTFADQPFPVRKIFLKTNYRCSPAIVQAADRLIRHNVMRYEKEVHAAKNSDQPVEYVTHADKRAQAQAVCKDIEMVLKSGYDPQEIAVLYRTNGQVRTVREMLLEKGIACKIANEQKSRLEHPAVQDLLAYLKLAIQEEAFGREELLRICNRPERGILRSRIEAPEITVQPQDGALYALLQQLRVLHTLPPYAALWEVRRRIGYEHYVMQQVSEHARGEWFSMMDELCEEAKGYGTIGTFLEERSKAEKKLPKKEEEKAGVTLSTIHQAKGLEYRLVHLLDLNEEILPHKQAVTKEETEEERRLCYVAMTRAKERLVLHSVYESSRRTLPLSRFLYESGVLPVDF